MINISEIIIVRKYKNVWYGVGGKIVGVWEN